MKFRYLLIGMSAIGLLTLAACKKDDNGGDQPQKTVAERIQTKWNIENVIIHGKISATDTTSAVDTTLNLPALTDDYFDIRSDNKIYSKFRDQMDTLDYVLQNDSTLIIKKYSYFIPNGDATYSIRNLSDNTLTLYTKEYVPTNPADFIEETNNLKK